MMEKDGLGAFIDAVLAIIMTILVLELPRPETYDIAGLWALRTNFFAYALSFFWLGAMWVNIHQSYHAVEKISQKTVWSAIVMLFFSSFYPYATKLIADAFFNKAMQGLYACLNYNEAFCPHQIENQSICIDGDADTILASLK